EIAFELASFVLRDQDDRALGAEMHLDPGGHRDVGGGSGFESRVERRVEVPHLAPEPDDRADVLRAGAADHISFFQSAGSGALEVVRRTFMKARVRTVRKSSGSTPGRAPLFWAKKFSMRPGASSIVDPASDCSRRLPEPAGSSRKGP